MKKLIYSVWTLAVMMLTFPSCTNDDAPEEVQITFKTALAQNANSRASLSDGSKINKVKCEVYEEVDNQKIKRTEDIVNFSDNKAEYKPTLLKGRTYTAVFFAYTEGSYCVSDLQDVTRLKNNCNDETMDAFSNVVNVNTEVTGTNLEVKLTRPLAQLNFATTSEDIMNARKLLSANGLNNEEPSMTLCNTSVKIAKMSSSYNVLTGNSNTSTSTDQVLTTAVIPSTASAIAVGDVNYKLLATAYLFPGETTTCYLNVYASSGGESETPTLVNKTDWTLAYSNVPLSTNTRTNVVGSLMTGNVPYQIVLDTNFGEIVQNSDSNGSFSNQDENNENNNQ